MTAQPPSLRLDSGARAWTLVAAAACLLPLLLQLPAMLAWGAAGVATVVAMLSWQRPLPAWLRVLLAMALLAAVFWVMGPRPGRDTGCALLAVMLALKPSETASLRDARSLLGFALFAPFAAFLLDQGPLSMGLGLLAVLTALLALQRLADAEAGLVTRGLSLRRALPATGKLVLIGLPLALVAFWLFPRLGSPLWGVPERALARPGLSDEMTPGEWIDLLADDTPALRAQFFGPAPPPEQMYWRGPVLWDFDGRRWTRPMGFRGRPAEPFVAGPARWDYQIEFEPTDRRQLVALDLPLAAPAQARLDGDYGLFADRPLSALSRWRLQSAPPARYQPQLSPALRQLALRLPSGYNPRTLALARQWRAQVGNDDAAIVDRALQMIRADFGYTLTTPLPGRNSVDEFLFEQKQGYCEHFSSSFVVLMRAARIPARVVTGYVGGYRNPFGDYWVVRRMDAHAWAEVWLPQRGWVRVDPTAAVAPERIYDTLEDRLGPQADALPALTRFVDFGDWLRRGWNDLVLGFNSQRQKMMLSSFGVDELDEGDLGLLFAVFAILALAGMAWLLARGERQRDPLLRAWHRLGRRYAQLGLGRELHEPALTWAARVTKTTGNEELSLLSQRFSKARYAADVGDTARLVRDLHRHRPRHRSPP
ncbi:hypothetical protein CSC70_09450 [Pseudoxanthomonas kalamensis DSM 18571]|uniref:transglutaminase family protein n=1 Tax=Pseudoxanthomonas kalamensis TaxID=289483 RepID=UPI0013916D57|nr:DUF3488 and transglutaminase-like domain-containing protein [Pseudoxanthomonas kalamensis]KAF1709907.1 hypothetical protein CSC70_09450 [Pseudoxanthomonas kalamensis DSM 18571]